MSFMRLDGPSYYGFDSQNFTATPKHSNGTAEAANNASKDANSSAAFDKSSFNLNIPGGWGASHSATKENPAGQDNFHPPSPQQPPQPQPQHRAPDDVRSKPHSRQRGPPPHLHRSFSLSVNLENVNPTANEYKRQTPNQRPARSTRRRFNSRSATMANRAGIPHTPLSGAGRPARGPSFRAQQRNFNPYARPTYPGSNPLGCTAGNPMPADKSSDDEIDLSTIRPLADPEVNTQYSMEDFANMSPRKLKELVLKAHARTALAKLHEARLDEARARAELQDFLDRVERCPTGVDATTGADAGVRDASFALSIMSFDDTSSNTQPSHSFSYASNASFEPDADPVTRARLKEEISARLSERVKLRKKAQRELDNAERIKTREEENARERERQKLVEEARMECARREKERVEQEQEAQRRARAQAQAEAEARARGLDEQERLQRERIQRLQEEMERLEKQHLAEQQRQQAEERERIYAAQRAAEAEARARAEAQRRAREEQERRRREQQEAEARRRREAEERRQREFLGSAEAQSHRLAELHRQAEAATQKMYVDEPFYQACRQKYEALWNHLSASTRPAVFIERGVFPWPASVAYSFAIDHIESLPHLLTPSTIQAFLWHGLQPHETSLAKRNILDATRRFHPDKLARIRSKIRPEDAEFVEAGFGIVSRVLTQLKAQLEEHVRSVQNSRS